MLLPYCWTPLNSVFIGSWIVTIDSAFFVRETKPKKERHKDPCITKSKSDKEKQHTYALCDTAYRLLVCLASDFDVDLVYV